MRTGLFALAAAAVLAATIPATAQEFRFRAGDEGVGVRVGRDYDGYRWHEGRRWREGCRVIIIKRRNADGDMITKRIRKCD